MYYIVSTGLSIMQTEKRTVTIDPKIVDAFYGVASEDQDFDSFVIDAVLEKIQDMEDIRDARAILSESDREPRVSAKEFFKEFYS